MAVIGVVADDFTGTASSGVLVAKSDARTGLFFDAKALQKFEDSDRLDAVYVSSNSRHMMPEEAYNAVKETTEELKKMGIKYYSKKIDTTLRGGIGYEIDAMLEELEEDTIAVVVTAMPQSNRICVGGYSIIDGVLLTETSVAHDVKTPVKECYVPALLGEQTKYRTELVNLRDVLKGQNVLEQCMKEARKNGARVIIVDAMTMENVDTIAKCCVDLGWKILAVDPGPFTMKLAYHRQLIGESKEHTQEKVERNKKKTALLVVGSANPSTRVQIDRLCMSDKENVKISVSPLKLLEGGITAETEIQETYEKIAALFEKEMCPKSIVVETALHGSVVNLEEEDYRHGYPQGTSSGLINKGLAEITEMVLAQIGQERIAGLLLTGGDTMECVCRHIGVKCIQATDNIVAQVDVGRIIGKYDNLPLIVKGGFCGYDDVAIDIVERLFAESEKRK